MTSRSINIFTIENHNKLKCFGKKIFIGVAATIWKGVIIFNVYSKSFLFFYFVDK